MDIPCQLPFFVLLSQIYPGRGGGVHFCEQPQLKAFAKCCQFFHTALNASWSGASALLTSQVPRPTCGSGSGERRVCTRGIFLPWQIVANIFIESGQLRTELAFSTRELALSH